jgi:acid phosphatase type 7
VPSLPSIIPVYKMRALSFFGGVAAILSLGVPAQAATNATINSQVRLAYAGSTGMYVSWNSFFKLDNPTVKYGLSPSFLNQSASSNVSLTYPTSLTYNNHVKISGLKPDTIYYYTPIGILKDNSTSLPYAFKTSRQAGDDTPYSIAVVVDLGTFGPLGLTTYAGKGVASTNVLGPHDNTTIQSLSAVKDSWEFLWHREILSSCQIHS